MTDEIINKPFLPRKELSSVELAKALLTKSPDQWANLIRALTLAPDGLNKLQLERFAHHPEDNPITPAQHEFLHEWILGHFAISNKTGDMIRVSVKPAAVVALGVKHDEYNLRYTEFLPVGQGALGGKVTPGNVKGADIPTGEDAKLAARKRADRDAEAKRKKKPVSLLPKFGKG